MEIKIITDLNALLVVTLANMRNYLEFTSTDATEDTLITMLIKAAVKLCENFTGEAFGEKTVEVFVNVTELDSDQRIDLPLYPFGAMTSVTPIDVEGTEGEELVLNTGYYLNGNQRKSIKLLTQSFLVGTDSKESYYKIRYTCGYGITSTTELIPEVYQFAVMEQVRLWYVREFNGKLDKSVIALLQSVANLPMV